MKYSNAWLGVVGLGVLVAACGGGNGGDGDASSSSGGAGTTGQAADGGTNDGPSTTTRSTDDSGSNATSGSGGSGGPTAGVGGGNGGSSGDGGDGGDGGNGGDGAGGDGGSGGTAGSAGSGGIAGNAGSGGGGDASGGSAGTVGTGGDAGTGGTGGVPDDAAIKIVVLGASTAAGKNLDQPMYGGQVDGLADSWPNRLAATLDSERPGSVVVNLAKSGYNTYHALPTGTVNPSGAPDVDPARNVTAALAEGPDALILSFPGAGETAIGDTAADIVDNFRIISDVAAAEGVLTWVATTQPHVDQTDAETLFGLEYWQATLDEFGSWALDFWTPLALSDDSGDPALFLTDNVHPNQWGHEALYDVVIAADIPSIALASGN